MKRSSLSCDGEFNFIRSHSLILSVYVYSIDSSSRGRKRSRNKIALTTVRCTRDNRIQLSWKVKKEKKKRRRRRRKLPLITLFTLLVRIVLTEQRQGYRKIVTLLCDTLVSSWLFALHQEHERERERETNVNGRERESEIEEKSKVH